MLSHKLNTLKMPSLENKPPLLILLGPTAVGKTAVSLELAERLGAEIVSADSRLLYRGMDIGTAKPTEQERARLPHHLIDVADPDEVWSLARYLQEAQEAIAAIHARGRLPLMVGGTGQYVRAFVEGWRVPRVEPDSRLRAVLERWAEEIGTQGLYDRLQRLDPQAAARIEPQNLRRTVRALEVILSTGERFSSQREAGESPYRQLLLGLQRPRSELYARVDARIEAMFSVGLVDEVQSLLANGYSPDLPPLSAIGYRQVIEYLRGEITLEEAKTQMRRITRRYIRQQANWFKQDDPRIRWFRARPGVAAEMETVVRAFLAGEN